MTSHQKQNQTILEEFGKQAAAYAKITGGGRNVSVERLIEKLQPCVADTLLDVGCGPGRLTLSLAQKVGRATGIDLTPAMLAQAHALQAERGIDNVRWVEGDILPLPFEDGAFTLVVTQATFHHFADPAAVLAQMTRVCAPGGRIAVIDLTPAMEKIENFDRVEKIRDPSHMRTMSPEALRGLGHAAGLEELDFWPYWTPMPAEAVLASSVCSTDALDGVRSLYRGDAASGADQIGLGLHEEDGQIVAHYPMTIAAWRKPQ